MEASVSSILPVIAGVLAVGLFAASQYSRDQANGCAPFAKTAVLFFAVACLLFAPTALPKDDVPPLVQALVYKFGLGLGCIGGSLMFVNWNPEEGLRDDFDNTQYHSLLGDEDYEKHDRLVTSLDAEQDQQATDLTGDLNRGGRRLLERLNRAQM